jgi:hypothetical protein
MGRAFKPKFEEKRDSTMQTPPHPSHARSEQRSKQRSQPAEQEFYKDPVEVVDRFARRRKIE